MGAVADLQAGGRREPLLELGAHFGVEYHRVEPDGSKVKLAVGKHSVAWMQRASTSDGRLHPAPWPAPLRAALERAAQAGSS